MWYQYSEIIENLRNGWEYIHSICKHKISHSSSELRDKTSITWTQITKAGAMWLWFYRYSMGVVLSAVRMKRGDLYNCLFCSEKGLAVPHGCDSLWHCILHTLSGVSCRVSCVLELSHSLWSSKKKNVGKLFCEILSVVTSRNSSSASCWGRAGQKWALFFLSGPWLCPHSWSQKPLHQNEADVYCSPLTLYSFRVWLRCPFEQ